MAVELDWAELNHAAGKKREANFFIGPFLLPIWKKCLSHYYYGYYCEPFLVAPTTRNGFCRPNRGFRSADGSPLPIEGADRLVRD